MQKRVGVFLQKSTPFTTTSASENGAAFNGCEPCNKLQSMITMKSISQHVSGFMASITIRNLDDKVKARLRIAAARHGCSMEEEVRQSVTVPKISKQSALTYLFNDSLSS